ncbi:MAG: Ig-like domain-containing protein [Clostridium sp.]|nr:Ig-like domain-containing protein [Clostridium sp.]
MKNFAKKLALVLALALVVTSVMPFSVSAASKITLKSGKAAPATVYAGHSYTLKVAGTKVKFTSSNKKVATIGLTSGKMKPVAPGKVKITAKNAKSGKAVASKTFTVLQRAKSITADAELYLGAVGDTATIKAVKAPATSTDVVRFYSADKTIATVGATSGKVTAVKEGKTTIKVYSKATKATANSSKNNKVATVEVFVGPAMASVTQKTATEFVVAFKADVKDVKAVDFSIENDTTKAKFPVKSAEVSKTDAKSVTITSFADIKDGASYTVTYKTTSAQFTATDGKIASLDITPVVATIGKATKVYAVAKDANGVEIEKVTTATLGSNYELNIETTNNGYMNGDALVLQDKTATAKVKAIYHTYKYENDVEVGKLEKEVTITATEADTVTASGVKYTIAKETPNFSSSSYKQNTAIAIGDVDYNVYLNIVDSGNTAVANYSDYKVESSDASILYVGALSETGVASVAGIKAGTAYILVKNATTNAQVTALAVTVKEAKKATNLQISKNSVTVSNAAGMNGDVTEITYKVLDQYGDEFTTDVVPVVRTITKAKDATAEEAAALLTVVDKKLVAQTTADTDKGTYQFGVKYEGLTEKIVTVNVVEAPASGSVAFVIKQDKDSIDQIVKTEDDYLKSVNFTVVMTKGGVSYATLPFSTEPSAAPEGSGYADVSVKTTVKNSDGKDVTKEYFADGVFTPFDIRQTLDIAPVGTYTFTFEITATKTDASKPADVFKRTATVKVENTQLKSSVNKVNEKYDGKFIVTKDGDKIKVDNISEAMNACYTFYYDGVKYGKDADKPIEVVDATITFANENYIAIKNVTYVVTLANGTDVPAVVELDSYISAK